MDDLEIKGPDQEEPVRSYSPHPWWSRLLYLIYGLFVGFGAFVAYEQGQAGLALAVAGVAAVLIWKAAQRVR